MTPREVAAVLREISQLLQLKGENAFKVRAYDLAADAFETLPPDPAAAGGLNELVKQGRLRELEGFGEKTEQSILEGIAKVRERQAARRSLWHTWPLAEQLLARVR